MSTSITSTTGAVNNPAITSKDVIEFREANLGFSGTVSTRYTDEARVGTTIRWGQVTVPNSGTARTKSEGNSGADITYDNTTESAITLTINQHMYSAFELEEFEKSLSIVDQNKWYTKAAAYALDTSIDDTLAALVDNFGNTVGTLAVDLTDDDVRRGVQYLDDANAPMDGRYFAMSPATKNSLLGVDRYASSDFNRGGGANIVRGTFGDIYGLTTWVSTNVEGTNAAGHDNAIYQRDALAMAMRMAPRTRRFDDIQNLSEQVSISAIWGVIETRDDHGVWAKGA
ncbi:MAG: hypothetical protein NUW01_14935 [Gemmatimonadaceae bacterium]|nr:hypothetical protein [Gemmatimonadaceae bacterium]